MSTSGTLPVVVSRRKIQLFQRFLPFLGLAITIVTLCLLRDYRSGVVCEVAFSRALSGFVGSWTVNLRRRSASAGAGVGTAARTDSADHGGVPVVSSFVGAAGECLAVRRQKFYLYEMPSVASLCKSGEALLKALKNSSHERSQQMGAELFLHQQLQDHAWRTEEPEEADLFVLPSILSLGATPGLCPGVLFEDIVQRFDEAISASPFYQRSQGKDHLLAMMDWRAVKLLFWDGPGRPPISTWVEKKILQNFTESAPSIFAAFRNTTRNFILSGKYEKEFLTHGEFMRPTAEGVRSITMPHLAPSSLKQCKWEDAQSRVVCLPSPSEDTFDAYRLNRPYTMFFIGNGNRHEIPGSRNVTDRAELRRQSKLVRPLVIDRLGDLHPPNILCDTKPQAPENATRPNCVFGDGPDSQQQITSGCNVVGHSLEPSSVRRMLGESKFAIHTRGDDASSSRVFEAIDTGTPQLFLADRYLLDVAPFKCEVDWRRVVKFLDVSAFTTDPRGTVAEALEGLMGGDGEEEDWRRLWEEQRRAARELLWHVPDSRVGHNIVTNAFRVLLREDRNRLPRAIDGH
mmetsp:Transcript_1744/g.3627  ORF Transcript_1744/g.3627 Transcript_1744/m.3627 type:complete len:572 (-) Transcript_1744:19-1734(-)